MSLGKIHGCSNHVFYSHYIHKHTCITLHLLKEWIAYMRVLFVAPYPLSRIRVRSYGFVKQLAKQHDVRVLALCASEQEREDVQMLRSEGIAITAIEEKRSQKMLRALQGWRTTQPLQVAFDASPALRAAIIAQVETGQFDVMHVEFIRSLGALPDTLPIPVIWDAVDCISQLYEQGAKFGATPMLRLIGKGEARRTRDYERVQLRRFREVLVTSERDKQALLKLVHESVGKSEAERNDEGRIAEITVLPHGIDQDYFYRYTGERSPATLVFSGKMSFHANVAGVQTFVEHILPLIWQRRPEVQLIIAGSAPSQAVRRLAQDSRITVTGYVPDLRPYITSATVAVSPLPYAVGIQNKILEAMAIGTPVVASPGAAAGLEVVNEQDLLIADGPEAFAASVLRLLDDQILWHRLSEQGLAYISAHHDWERIGARLVEVYTRAIAETQNALSLPM